MRKLSIRTPFALSALLASAWCPAAANPSGDVVVIHAAEVIVSPGEVVKDVDILVIDGVIRRVEAGIEVPEGARELNGEVVCAGMIDPWSVLGIHPADAAFTGSAPSTRTADAVNPFGQEFQKKQALASGVTAVRVQASRRALVSGLSSVMSLAPRGDEDLIASEETALGASVGLTNPSSGGSTFTRGADGSFTVTETGPTPMDPFERIGQVDKIVGMLQSGIAYRIAQNEYVEERKEWEETIEEKVKELEKDFKKAKKDRDKEIEEAEEEGKEFKEEKYKEDKAPRAPKFDADKEALARVANGEIPLVVEVHRTAEIRNLLEATAGFGRLRMVIAGGTEAGPFAEQLAERNIAVIVNPGPHGAGTFDEFDGHDVALAGILAEADVDVLIGTGGQKAGASRDLPLLAAIAVGGGMEADDALAAITSGPAKVFDLSDRGTIEFGKQADLLILDGQPLRTTTSVKAVLVGGRVVVEPKE
jgi:imidazolonepropionase-like amidohydrolase